MLHRKLRAIMKSAVIFFVVLVASQAAAIDGDKVAHFAGGGGTGLAVDTVMYHFASGMGPGQRMATSAALSLIPGFFIEVGDEFSPHNSFSWSDLLADGLGAVTGVIAAELINGQLWISASGRQIRLIGRW